MSSGSSGQPTNYPPLSVEEQKRFSIIVYNVPEELNDLGTLNSFFIKFGDIQKINVDLGKRSALIRFKRIESAERAAAAYFNKGKDEHIMGVPQIRIKYVTQPMSAATAA